ncbi:hypothetical protein BD560DRAFT_488045 [Blakeslea trispora]|nr:hypothetical protein BD560DRAFT_488045 [Blakeslea trispora]
MNRTNSLIKSYLRRLVLQTHPDYFQHHPLQKKKNADSLQKLNEILQSSLKDKKHKTVKLEFFSKHQKKEHAKSAKPAAVGLFDLSDSEWAKTQSFFDLCQQLDIPIMQTDLEAVQDMIRKENKSFAANKSLTREFAKKLYKDYQQTSYDHAWQLHDILGNKMIMFGPSVDKTKVAQHLCDWLPQLQPQKWWNKIPVLVLPPDIEKPSIEASKGMIVFDSGMTLEDLKHYLSQRLDEILEEVNSQ